MMGISAIHVGAQVFKGSGDSNIVDLIAMKRDEATIISS